MLNMSELIEGATGTIAAIARLLYVRHEQADVGLYLATV